MELTVEMRPGQRAIVRPNGRLDARVAEELKSRLKDTVNNGATHLVLDMAKVPFIDSSGLSALVSAFKAVREKGGMLLLVDVSPQVKVALELTQLNRIFLNFDTVEAALDQLGPVEEKKEPPKAAPVPPAVSPTAAKPAPDPAEQAKPTNPADTLPPGTTPLANPPESKS